MPLQFLGWSVRPALTLHETYYTERFVGGLAVDDPTNRQALEASVEVRPPVLEKVFGKEFLGKKWKHVIEPRAIYRFVTGVNDFANVLHFDERDILSNTHEVEYGLVTRLYAKPSPAQAQECESPMTGIAVGAAAPEQTGSVAARQQSRQPALQHGSSKSGKWPPGKLPKNIFSTRTLAERWWPDNATSLPPPKI